MRIYRIARIDDTNRLSAGTRQIGGGWRGGGKEAEAEEEAIRVCCAMLAHYTNPRAIPHSRESRVPTRPGCTCVKLHVAGWVSPIFMGNISDSAAAIEALTSSTCPQ